MSYAKLIGSGGYLPPRVVSNDELAAELAQQGIETSDAWIRERTGIQQRHLVEHGVKTSELATKAAQAALADAGITADQLDLIILATATPDFVFPSTACIVQAALGASNAAAFDVQAVCSGFVYALTTADAYIQAGRAKTVLVIGAEVFSRILDWRDRGTCVLFGDGAGAVIMQASDKSGVIGAKLHADGNYANILCTPGNVDQGQVTGDPFLRMDGQAVFKFAVTALADSAQQVCDDAGIRLQDIDWLVPHQANVRILNFLSRKLGVDNDKVIVTVAEHANTSAASVPLALDVARRDGRIKSGDLVLLQGVGGGFTWGSVLLRI